MSKIDHAPKHDVQSRWLRAAGIVGAGTLAVTIAIHVGNEEPSNMSPPRNAVTLTTAQEMHSAKLVFGNQAPQLVSRPATVSRAGKPQIVPSRDCWDGSISDLNHVPKSREKIALANIALACEVVKDEPWFKKSPQRQMGCLVMLWDRESGWYQKSGNPKEAFGIPQSVPGNKMASAGADWQTNPETQIDWGTDYIDDRYGTPCEALKHHDDHNWY